VLNGSAMTKGARVQGSASDYLAAERTFLAWIRTGIALMGLGFVLARFGLFLQEFNRIALSSPPKSNPISLAIGVTLILLGVATCLLSMLRHLRMLKQLQAGESLYAQPPQLAVGVAAVLIVLGLIMAGYLIFANPNAVVRTSIYREETMAASMAPGAENGIVRLQGKHSVDDTVAKLQSILQAKGVKLFIVVDHSGEAASAGLQMPNTKVLIFGNPKAGTPLMLAAPSIALDLPLKILVAEDATGKTWISYNAPAYLQARHSLPADLLPNIAVIEALVAKAAE
jgi:uncharacterized protein (DUF302 family)/uncharacterized membrane protein YidH (DUF202 family)